MTEHYDADRDHPFDPYATKMALIQARGHLTRTGHELTGFYREVESGIYRLIYTCACRDN